MRVCHLVVELSSQLGLGVALGCGTNIICLAITVSKRMVRGPRSLTTSDVILFFLFFSWKIFIKAFTKAGRSISSYFLVSLLLQSTLVVPQAGHHHHRGLIKTLL